MSAWAQVVLADGSDEWLKVVQAALSEVQAETRRRTLRVAAEELRTRFEPEARAVDPWADGWMSAADYIDPEVDST